MNRICACLTFGMALMATAAPAAEQRTTRTIGSLLGGPTLLANLQAPDLPMPAPLSPVPEIQYSGPVGQMPVVTNSSAITLFQCVKYRDTRNIAPCAVPIIVQVPDPCVPRDRCGCTPRPCVFVEICVPSCGCPKVCVTRHGNKTRYDYGKYAVDIVSVNGRVVVDYDD
jgi:hypothetical protein